MSDIDAELKDLLVQAKARLMVDASDKAKGEIDGRIEAVAASLALEWITGVRRFESQGQQTEYWLSRIYEALYPDEQPDATRLYTRFGLPLPRAQYVTRLLLARRSAHWRQAARTEVTTALETFEKNAREAIKAGAGSTAFYKLSLSRGGYDELVVVYDRMVSQIAGQDRPSPPRKEPSSPTFVVCTLNALGLIALVERVRKEK